MTRTTLFLKELMRLIGRLWQRSHPVSGMRRKLNLKRRYVLLAGLLSFAIVACTAGTQSQGTQSQVQSINPSSAATGPLTIWWEKGFNLEEDEALQALVADWEKQSGKQANLSLYTTDDLPQRTERALAAGNPPDILMSHNAERALYPRLAWQGKLVDVSDVVKPVESQYPDSILNTVYFYNNTEKKRSYYGVPISQSSNYIFYWRDLIEKAGYKDSDIPRDWNGFWSFWEDVQDKLRQQPDTKNIYAMGFSLSDKAGDTYYVFEQALEAGGVQILTPDGKLQIDDPEVRKGILQTLKWYTQFYQQGYMPKDSIKWLNPDNNTALLNRSIVMTPNTSLTIAATVRQDAEVYRKKLVTMEFPKNLQGQPTRHILTIKQAVIFTEAANQATAKEFLSYLIQPQVLGKYLKSAGIRNLPVTKTVWQDSFWTNPDDPHLSVAAKVLQSNDTRPFPSVYHPAYSLVTQENVWGKAVNRIVVEGITPQQAADESIARIKEIFADWQ